MGFKTKTRSIQQEKKTSKKLKAGDFEDTSDTYRSKNATVPKPTEKCKLIKTTRTMQVKKTRVTKAKSQHNEANSATDAVEECAMCGEGYRRGDELGAMPCGHYFHRRCIDQWLVANSWCPVCGVDQFDENVPLDDSVLPETRVRPTSWVSALSWSNLLSSCWNVKLFFDRVEWAYDQWIALYRCAVLIRWLVPYMWRLITLPLSNKRKPKFHMLKQ